MHRIVKIVAALAAVLLLLASNAVAACRPQEPVDPEAVEQARLARLTEIAQAIQPAEADAVALFTEAVRLAGFVLWSEDRAVLAQPTGSPRLHLAITDTEIRAACIMFRAGHVVGRDDLLAGIDAVFPPFDASKLASTAAKSWFRRGFDAADPSARALHRLIDALGRQRAGANHAIDGDEDSEFDPLQALLLVRVLTEEIAVPLRRHLAGAAADDGGRPRKGPIGVEDGCRFEAPGWAEDAFVGGVTGLVGKAVEQLGRAGEIASKGLTYANALGALTKCILSYAFLKGELRVEAPGEPLVRNKNTDSGQRRTLVARLWIDGTEATEIMKEFRKSVAAFGVDIDMPKSTVLRGVETEWDIKENRFSTKTHLLELPQGHPRIDKIKTDEQGEARITVDGRRRSRAIDDRQCLPVDKTVRITVQPQLKSPEVQQDLVDAVLGAIGVAEGPVGVVAPITECLYRMKWKIVCEKRLRVRDWAPMDTVGQVEVRIEANGFEAGERIAISRMARFTDVALDSSGFDAPPELDPALLALMNKKQRQALKDAFEMQASLANQRIFEVRGPGRLAFDLRDATYRRDTIDECSGETVEVSTRAIGTVAEDIEANSTFLSGSFGLRIDTAKKAAWLQVHARCVAEVASSSKRAGKVVKETSSAEKDLFADLVLDDPMQAMRVETTLRESPSSDPAIVNYHGVAAVPFRFGDRSQFRGTAFLSWSIGRRLAGK